MDSKKLEKKASACLSMEDPDVKVKLVSNKCWQIDKEMLPLKVHFFLFIGALGASLPYMTVFAKNRVGLSATSLAIVLTIQQFLFILTKPLIGFIADYFNKLKLIIFVMTVMQAVLLFMLLAIPKIDTSDIIDLPLDGTDVCDWYDTCKPLSFKQYPLHKEENQSSIIVQSRNFCLFSENSSDIAPNYFELLQSVSNDKNDSSSITSSNGDEERHFIPTVESGYAFFQCEQDFNKSCAHLTEKCFVCCEGDSHCNVVSCASNPSWETTNLETFKDFQTYEFWTFAVIYILSSICTNGLCTLSDTACCESVHKHGSDFGRQRLYGTVGHGITAVVGGYLNDYTDDYLASWILMGILSALTLCNLYRMNLVKPQFSQRILSNVGTVLASKEYLAFALMVFMSGMGYGMINFYLIWFLTTIGGSRLLCGLTLAVQSFIGEIPFMFFSGWIIRKLGHFHVMTLALASYCIRFAWYSYLSNPWMVLPVDSLHGFTFGVFYAAVASYAKLSAKPGTEATTQAVLFSTHEGLGAGLGCVLAGIGIDRIGGHRTFFFASIFSGLGAVISSILRLLIRRNATRSRNLLI